MPKPIERETLDESLGWYSDAVSKGVRTIAFGSIAGVWAVLTADSLTIKSALAFGISTSLVVTATFVLASFTLLADIGQYVAAFRMTDIGIDRWEASEEKGEEVKFYYDKKNLGEWGHFLYKLNHKLLRVKCILAVLTGIMFVSFAFSIELS